MSEHQPLHPSWATRWTFIMAATGSAVGLGNIWKFPYITGEYGGGAFVLVYLLCISLIGIPVMMAEILIGRRGRRNPIDTLRQLAKEEKTKAFWPIIGWVGLIAGILILSYYSVIAGWALEYTLGMAQGDFTGQPAEVVKGKFTQLLQNDHLMIAWHGAFMGLTAIVVGAGVTRGLGVAVRIMMPVLFVLLLALLAYSYQLGNFMEGVHFLFDFDFSKLSAKAVLVAMGHSFFTLSLGMGAIMVYGSYMPANASIGRTVIMVALLDTLVALGAGLAIFPLVFANGIAPSSGPGLMFVSLPIAFSSMENGALFGTLFFILVTIAAWSSAISLIEPAVAYVNEKYGTPRPIITGAISILAWALGLGSIYSNNWLGQNPANNWYVFETIDMLTANILLPLGGLAVALFAGWAMRRKTVRDELKDLPLPAFNLWYGCTRVIAPLGIIAIFLNSIGVI